MSLKEIVLNTVTVIAVGCAAVVTVNNVRGGGKLFGSGTSQPDQAPFEVAEFEQLKRTGLRIGPADAAITIVEFGDFQCPACADFAVRVETLMARKPSEVALVWHHIPLPYHRLALPLARASECANAQGRFKEFYYAAFKHQRDFGLITVADLGPKAGVPDIPTFNRCLRDTSELSSVRADTVIARKIGVDGTPGLLMNGKYYPNRGVLFGQLEKMITDVEPARPGGH